MSFPIAADFPFTGQTVPVKDSFLHYVEQGTGEPVLFLHGVPTWSYLWRNVIPNIAKTHRAIAVDLIGFGRSGKPDISYRVFDHINYIEGFIEALHLRGITLVLHGWGSVIGFALMARHPEWFKRVAFMEAHLRPPSGWETLSLPVQELASLLASPDGGYDVVMKSNYIVNTVLPSGVLRPLTEQEMSFYREPFQEPGSCKPIWQYLQDLPLGDGPADVMALMQDYAEFLQKSAVPKLLIYAIPGYVTTISQIEWSQQYLPNLTTVDIGDGLHYIQENEPEGIANAIVEWLA
jgi:haloalkane dehalogenase